MSKVPNIILLTIDALRADHLSCHGYDRETSPRLDQIAGENIWFDSAWSVSSHTREAMPPLLGGEWPSVYTANGFKQVDNSLPERLRDAGYRTAGFHSNPYLSRAYDFNKGFDSFYDDLFLGQNRILALAQQAFRKYVLGRGEYYARAPEINRRALDWLDSINDGPFFLWNHYMDVHGPYHPPETVYAEESVSASRAESLYQKAWKRPDEITDFEHRLLEDSYDDEIRCLDRHIGTIFDELDDRGLYEDSLIVVTADHGDAFGEHGHYTHPRHLYEYLLHVPLIISPPGDGTETRVTDPVSTIGVVPTMLKYADLSASDMPGDPLLDESNTPVHSGEDIVYAMATGEGDQENIQRFAARDSRWKVMTDREIESGAIIEERAFDLSEDSEEREVVSPDDERVEPLFDRLREFSASRLMSIDGGVERETDDEQLDEINERLEALGYK